jgi:hypothetical protein
MSITGIIIDKREQEKSGFHLSWFHMMEAALCWTSASARAE